MQPVYSAALCFSRNRRHTHTHTRSILTLSLLTLSALSLLDLLSLLLRPRKTLLAGCSASNISHTLAGVPFGCMSPLASPPLPLLIIAIPHPLSLSPSLTLPSLSRSRAVLILCAQIPGLEFSCISQTNKATKWFQVKPVRTFPAGRLPGYLNTGGP